MLLSFLSRDLTNHMDYKQGFLKTNTYTRIQLINFCFAKNTIYVFDLMRYICQQTALVDEFTVRIANHLAFPSKQIFQQTDPWGESVNFYSFK